VKRSGLPFEVITMLFEEVKELITLAQQFAAKDAEQLLTGWQRIAEGLIRIKATAREVRAVRSLLSSRLALVADILGIHCTCAEARAVFSSGGS
jgi:hypothetical protein